jgi:uncharacterized protein with HEPN domain
VEQFAADERTVDAVIRNFSSSAKRRGMPPDHVRALAPQIPWKLMEGMRHVLVHDYGSVKLDTVRQTVREDLPPLVARPRRLVA